MDLNADVLAIRRLRAAAALPQFFALCCVLFALLFSALDENRWRIPLSLLCTAALLILLARSMERGARWALWALTAIVLAMTVLGVGAMFQVAAPMTERAQGAAGIALILTPCWVLVSLGWRATPASASVVQAVSRSTWSRVPRGQRSREAFGSFTAAVLIYGAGVLPAGLAALAVGGHLWASALVYWPIAAVAGRVWNRGRRQSALGLQETRKLDARRPVLLLRSFGDDNLPLEKRYHLFWFLFAAPEALTLESFVVDQIWHLGPVLAIGNPGEHLSPLGAAREYIPDDRWRARIQQYLNEAEFVVSILGDTPGLSWEYQQIQALKKDGRVLVVFPPRPAEELQRRWALFQTSFERARTSALQWKPFIGVPLVAFFAPDVEALLYCKYRHETAYAAAFSRLFDVIGNSSADAS